MLASDTPSCRWCSTVRLMSWIGKFMNMSTVCIAPASRTTFQSNVSLYGSSRHNPLLKSLYCKRGKTSCSSTSLRFRDEELHLAGFRQCPAIPVFCYRRGQSNGIRGIEAVPRARLTDYPKPSLHSSWIDGSQYPRRHLCTHERTMGSAD